LNRDSRERVKAAVLGLLDSITARQTAGADDTDIVTVEDTVEEVSVDV
jgi:hypothetical protein